jgi:hypothetical protein
MRHFPIRRSFVLGFFAASLLLSLGASLEIARADVETTHPPLPERATAPIGLGFNYTGSSGFVVVYVAAPGPTPSPAITQGGSTYCEVMQLPGGVTASDPNPGSTPLPDESDSGTPVNGSLYLYAQMSGCGSSLALSPISLLLPLTTIGGNNKIMVAWGASATAPATPAGYSIEANALQFVKGLTAKWDNTNRLNLLNGGKSGTLFIFAQCSAKAC